MFTHRRTRHRETVNGRPGPRFITRVLRPRFDSKMNERRQVLRLRNNSKGAPLLGPLINRLRPFKTGIQRTRPPGFSLNVRVRRPVRGQPLLPKNVINNEPIRLNRVRESPRSPNQNVPHVGCQSANRPPKMNHRLNNRTGPVLI